MTQPTTANVAVWSPPGAEDVPWLRALVTTRHGGTSPAPYDSLNLGLATGDDATRVAANRARLCAALGLLDDRIVKLSQVHGTRVWRVPDAAAREGDGLWTAVPGPVLAIGVADCVPAFVWDVAVPRIALVHAGWRGTAAGILGEAIAILRRAGSHAADLRCALGPSIGPCCYTVGPDVAAHFPTDAVRREQAELQLDLWRANQLQAEARGLEPEQVHSSPPCTACNREQFFSHRRDGPRTGRMWALAWIEPDRAARPSGARPPARAS